MPTPYTYEAMLSYHDYHIYEQANSSITPNCVSKLDVLSRVMFLAGSKLTSFATCNITDYVLKCIATVKRMPNIEMASTKMLEYLDKGCCGVPYHIIKDFEKYDVDDEQYKANDAIGKRMAFLETQVFLVELYNWKRYNML